MAMMEYALSFNNKSIGQILAELHQLTEDTTSLIFSDINATTDFDIVIMAVRAIPYHINSLDLSDSELGQRTVSALRHLFRFMRPTLEKLNLSNNGLNQIDLPVGSLRDELKWLDLSYNEYNVQHNFSLVIPQLPAKLETLEMHGNGLEDLDYSVLKTLCDTIKEKKAALNRIISGAFSIDPQHFNETTYAVTFKLTNTPLEQNPLARIAAQSFGIFAEKIHEKLQESSLALCAIATLVGESASVEYQSR